MIKAQGEGEVQLMGDSGGIENRETPKQESSLNMCVFDYCVYVQCLFSKRTLI